MIGIMMEKIFRSFEVKERWKLERQVFQISQYWRLFKK